MSSHVPLSTGLPETILPALDPSAADALQRAITSSPDARRAALAEVAARWPRMLDVWPELCGVAADDIEAYAYARVGYHRGLDTLRANGWRGSGYVRWRNPTNRGFLRCLDALRRCAGAIGEDDEEERCRLFLRQLDPNWEQRGPGAQGA
jgi:hypothetical protein